MNMLVRQRTPDATDAQFVVRSLKTWRETLNAVTAVADEERKVLLSEPTPEHSIVFFVKAFAIAEHGNGVESRWHAAYIRALIQLASRSGFQPQPQLAQNKSTVLS